jgi:DNA-binding NarL/FixJ family response regulator
MGMSNYRILLADDHAMVRAGIRKIIEELPGLEVVGEVSNGPELLLALERLRPDCLLMDVTMPDFNPIASIYQFRSDYPALKILVVSAYDDDIYVQGLLKAGVNGYHLKDQPLSDLQLAVQRVLAGDTWLSGPLISRLVLGSDKRLHQPRLTGRQLELLRLLCRGLDNQAIALEVGLSVKTVENHLTRLYKQLNVQSRLQAMQYVIEHPDLLGVSGRSPVENSANLKPAHADDIVVLVVDDSQRYRQQLQRMIAKVCPDAVVYEAEDIRSAVHFSQMVSPQLVLVDVVLGEGEDGIRCTRRIKAVTPQARVVLISAYPDREFHRRGLEAGAVAFLDKKDLDVPTLRQVIQNLG